MYIYIYIYMNKFITIIIKIFFYSNTDPSCSMLIIMEIKYMVFVFFLGVLLSTPMFGLLGGAVCNERERNALLTFKQDLNDTSNSLSSWNGSTDCCSWHGVVCNNDTESSVVELRLDVLGLSGELNPCLVELKYLNHLDLSYNFFGGTPIPTFLGSFQNLRNLDLAISGFVVIDGLEWISNLSSLQYLNMTFLDLSRASSNWFHSISMLPSLLELRLHGCELDSIPSLSYVNFTSLEILVFSFNKISSSFPNWLSNLTSLKELNLFHNNFRGKIPMAIGGLTSLTKLDLGNNEFEGKVLRPLGNLCNLQRLDLSGNKFDGELSEFFQNSSSGCIANSLESLKLGSNQFSGSIPSSIGSYSLLQYLVLRDNKLNGSLPRSLRLLSKMEYLLLSDNNAFEGIVTEFHFANLTSLIALEMDSVVLKLKLDWIPPFQLEILKLRNCHFGPQFPRWLRTQKQITSLDLSRNEISSAVPAWFWNMTSQLWYLNLSHNHLSGELPSLLNTSLSKIYLSSNMFKGQLPLISPRVEQLDLSNNSISGPISVLLCNTVDKMELYVLDLSRNLLSGELSECWSNWKRLRVILLGSNNIIGRIPSSIGYLLKLQSLHLRNNSLSRELPSSLQNCTNLVAIDLGENGFTGSIPKWMGQSLPGLMFLRLRSNKFNGGIPQEFCHLSSLQVLDLAHNNISGTIPRCFNNFTAMVSKRNETAILIESQIEMSSSSVIRTLIMEIGSLVTKGKELEYRNTLGLVTSMDLSKNNLSGEIPVELTSLLGLRSLNLSENHFIGKIPEKIGRMSLLESLDFSNNKLSGLIPQSMTNLTFLGHLNLSYNNLSGQIPSSTQLEGFVVGSYMGNPELCGPPLERCNADQQPRQPPDDDENTEEDEDWIEMKWFYVSLPLGLATGFWGFIGVLLLKKSWRFAYFRFVGDIISKFYRS